jgi:hypothetical protein
MPEPIRDLSYFKDVLLQAIAISDKFTVQTKQKILAFKELIAEYTKLVERFDEENGEANSMMDRTGEELELESMYKELERMGTEIFKEIEMVKKAYS